MHKPPIERLQQMALFGAIREDVLAFILTVAPMVAVAEGNFFFREGDTAESMFVLQTGRVVVLKGLPGKQLRLRELNPGDCFGELSLIDLSPRSASVRAVENCTALEISTACLYQVYEKDVEQFAMIEMNMGREVSRRLREIDDALSALRLAGDVGSDGAP
jgi:CRP-like cAMP-binding protein